MIVKSESRRCSNSHSKQCCSNSHTRRSSRRCWCYHRQARPQGRSIGRRTQYPYIFNFLYIHTSKGGLLPLSPCAAYAAKGSSQEGEPPKLQSAEEAVLFKATDAPQGAPLPAPPPTSATARIAMLIQ